jgi:hypothetical protein
MLRRRASAPLAILNIKACAALGIDVLRWDAQSRGIERRPKRRRILVQQPGGLDLAITDLLQRA